MKGPTLLRRMAYPLLAASLALSVSQGAMASSTQAADIHVGTLKAERYGDHGRPVILIPGLEGGPWVWEQTIAQLQKDHVVYAVTLAGFDGMPAPKDASHLLDRADASLLDLIKQQKLDKPVLIGHSLGGTLSLRFAGEHPQLISGVLAADGLPILPGLDQMGEDQRKGIAKMTHDQMAAMTRDQFNSKALEYMKAVGVIDPSQAERYTPFNTRSDVGATAEYMAEDMAADYRPGLKQANVPIVVVSPYYAPDFSKPPMKFTEQEKADYYKTLLGEAPNAKVVSISPSRHFVMLDQPEKFQQAVHDFMATL